MKRIFLTALGMFALLQSYSQKIVDSTGYKSRKLKIDEINLVSSYYSQDGNRSAVTGGIGSEELMDIANIIELKMVSYDGKSRKHQFDLELGLDYYTSASSDMIDLKANSSASQQDFRFYPSLGWTVENEKKGRSMGIGISSSIESDYVSYGANIRYSKKSNNGNAEFTGKLQVYFDQVKLIAPIELRPFPLSAGLGQYPFTSRNSYTLAFTYSRVINERLQLMVLADLAWQHGYLGLPFHRVYLDDGSLRQEKLPDTRFKLPLGIRASYFLGDRFIIKGYYRFYTDDWGLHSHTANIEVPVKITPFFSVSPFYRFYDQSGARYFNGFRMHTSQDEYYTSSYDLSKFNSHFLGMGIRLEPPKGIFGIRRFNMIELRYGHYTKNIGMNADIISMNLRFK